MGWKNFAEVCQALPAKVVCMSLQEFATHFEEEHINARRTGQQSQDRTGFGVAPSAGTPATVL
jgi:hypothetical protein